MKAVIQRCRSAQIDVDGVNVGRIGPGLVIFLGVMTGDGEQQIVKLAAKVKALRIFSDEQGRFNHSVSDVGGSILIIPNFTICGDTRKGNRPNFSNAAAPPVANEMFQQFAKLLSESNIPVETGVFGADMRVFVENDGPVSVILEV